MNRTTLRNAMLVISGPTIAEPLILAGREPADSPDLKEAYRLLQIGRICGFSPGQYERFRNARTPEPRK